MSIDTRGLDQLILSMSNRIPDIKIGIIGDSARSDGKLANAEIGAIHEFGLGGHPERSFLRVPLRTQMPVKMKSAKMDRAALMRVLKSGNLTPWCQKIAVIAEAVVQEAFETGGYGEWEPSDMKNKKIQMTLIETTQLRNSIATEVV